MAVVGIGAPWVSSMVRVSWTAGHAGAHVGRQHAFQLGQRPFHGDGVGHESQATSPEHQPQREGPALVIREDEGREAEPAESGAAVAAPAQLSTGMPRSEHGDVAADGAQIDSPTARPTPGPRACPGLAAIREPSGLASWGGTRVGSSAPVLLHMVRNLGVLGEPKADLPCPHSRYDRAEKEHMFFRPEPESVPHGPCPGGRRRTRGEVGFMHRSLCRDLEVYARDFQERHPDEANVPERIVERGGGRRWAPSPP